MKKTLRSKQSEKTLRQNIEGRTVESEVQGPLNIVSDCGPDLDICAIDNGLASVEPEIALVPVISDSDCEELQYEMVDEKGRRVTLHEERGGGITIRGYRAKR